MWKVLKTAKQVAEESVHVSISPPAVALFVSQLASGGLRAPSWDPGYHAVERGPDTVAYLLVLDSLNFCFWPAPGTPRWTVQYKEEELSGYYALAASLTRAVESGVPILRSEYLSAISLSDLKGVLQGEGELQLLTERLHILRELGKVLMDRYGGEAYKLVESAAGSAVRLTEVLAGEFASFRDSSQYRGREVFFYKRGQILAADLHGAFSGKEWGRFRDMDQLTAFADYKLPQVLRHLGILCYSSSLAEKVDWNQMIPAGSPEEVEIRSHTIWAVELIRQGLMDHGTRLGAYQIDGLLWHLGQKDRFREKPYHRTVTLFY